MSLRAGIIGLGVGEQHIGAYESRLDCEVTVICDKDPEVLEQVGSRHPGPRRETDANVLLEDPEIDVISIASYDSDHFDQVMRAIAAGKHVFVEKPLCQTAQQADAIRSALAERPDLQLSSNLPLRRSPRFRLVREMIAEGAFGKLFYLEADYQYGRLWKLTDGWRGDLDDYSVTLGGGVHMVDLLLWLTGMQVVEVSAVGNRIATEGTKFRHEDFVLATLRFDDGAIAKVSSNFGCVHPHYHAVKVFGTDATFVNGLEQGTIYRGNSLAMETEQVDAAYPGVNKGDLLEPFLESIVSGAAPEVSAEDVFATMSVCLAIDRALAEGSTVAVDRAR